MKNALLVFILAPFFTFAQSKTKPKATPQRMIAVQDSYVISGQATGYEDGTVVDLINGNNGQPENTTKITGGRFSFTGKLPFPDYKLLMVNKQHPPVPFFLENSNITITLNSQAPEAAVITGSKSNDEFAAYSKIYKKYEETIMNPPADSTMIRAGAQEFEKFALKNTNSYIAPIAIFRNFQLLGDGDKMEELFKKLSDPVQSTPVGDYIKDQIAKAKKNPMGKVLEDFVQEDTEGKPVKLSSLKGKYVLVDFWASWCGPCRQENPNLVAAYQRYKDKNFTILGVSLDKARQPWLDAIQADKLTWTHVSDLKFWQNSVAQKFGIESIPQNFLLDPSGVVIAKNLRGVALENKLASLLGH